MSRYLLVLVFAGACSAFAEESNRVQQFELTDGRTVQAARLIKISAGNKTSYLITLTDGRKLTFDADDVVRISDAKLSECEIPESLNVEKKPAVAAPNPKGTPAKNEPSADVATGETTHGQPEPAPPVRYYRRYYYDDSDSSYNPRPSPPSFPAPFANTPGPELTASDLARRAFTTIGGFGAKK